jgi:hypothetical protein
MGRSSGGLGDKWGVDMLNFDLNQNPPTAEEIAKEHKLTTRIFLLAGAVLILSIIGLRWIGATMTSGNEGVILGWFMDGGGDQAFRIVVMVGVLLTFSLLCGFGPLSGALGVVLFLAFIFGMEALLLAPRMWKDLSTADPSGGAALVAVLAFSLVLSTIVAGWGMARNDRLDDIGPSDCEQFVSDCLADPLCEQYRQKVAALGRKPVEAEVMMIREWVAGATAREQERREGIACAMVASKEPLPSDADTALKGEISC